MNCFGLINSSFFVCFYVITVFIFPLLSEIDEVIEKIDSWRPIYSFVEFFFIRNVSFKCESIKRIFLNNDIYSAHKLFRASTHVNAYISNLF